MEINSILNNSNNVYYGHGTKTDDQQVIDSIMINGLRCSHESLYYTSEELGIGGQIDDAQKEMLKNWPHLPQLGTSRVIIIISLPKKYNIYSHGRIQPLIGHSAYYYTPNEQSRKLYSLNDGLYVMPEFVYGYYNPKTSSIVSNRKYYEFLPPEKQNELFEQIKENYFNTLEDELLDDNFDIDDYREMLQIQGREFGLTDDELAKFKKQREQKQLLLEISPELLNRKMKLPNGEEIAAEKYLKEIVLPYIPTSGSITLNNGNEIPVSHFLMECVIFDCQQRYNGDFAKYMKECVKLDNNVLSQDDSTKAK